MFCAPAIVNRIGAKNALLTAGMIMSVRILGSSFASSAVEVVILKMLHMFEIPFLLVGTFKYISSAFNPRLSATLFLICQNSCPGWCFPPGWAGCTTPSASIRPI
jgi:OHS family lactose permease-like MFS transporter